MDDYICRRCKKNKTRYISLPCKKCVESKEYQKELKRFNKNWKYGRQLVGRFKEAVAFGHDKATGRPWAIGKKGEKFDPMLTRYAQHPNDRFGWKATGKKVREKDKYGNPNI